MVVSAIGMRGGSAKDVAASVVFLTPLPLFRCLVRPRPAAAVARFVVQVAEVVVASQNTSKAKYSVLSRRFGQWSHPYASSG